MAYVQSQKNNQRLITMGAVAALHAVAGYALISGLAVKFVEQTRDIFEARNVPSVTMPLKKPPTPAKDTVIRPEKSPISTDPVITFDHTDLVRLPDLEDIVAPDRPEIVPLDPPQRFAPLGARPRNNPGSWATEADYPSRAIREDREGVTKFMLSIDTSGRVVRCDIVGSSGHADLDARTCELVSSRARFEPARDGNGEQTTGSYTGSIRWQIPD